MVVELSEDNLQEVLNENSKVFVQFSASWCGNCRIMKPKFKKLASENDLILLSPGCSSLDMFSDYEERGNEFKRLVANLQNE